MKITLSLIATLLLTMTSLAQTNSKEFSIARIWHGWTTQQNAAELERILTQEAIPSINENKPAGLRGIQLLQRTVGKEVEFTTIMWFDNLEAVKEFAGEKYETAHIDPNVKPLLLRYDKKSTHHRMLYKGD